MTRPVTAKVTHPALPIFSEHPAVLLAPMEGVVDWVMRDLYTRYFAVDLCVTEFIRVTDRLLPRHEFLKYWPEMEQGSRTASGCPVLVQLLGSDLVTMPENAAFAAELGAPAVDLNFGCPAKTVNRHDGGAALLKNPERVGQVVAAVRRAVPTAVPVSAKVRLGFSDKARFLDIARAAEDGGAAWLTVHARTRDEMYQPPAHWEYIAEIREALRIPVIANGDVWTAEDYWRCREVSGCRHVMMGRGLMADPWLAMRCRAEAVAAQFESATPSQPSLIEARSLLRHLQEFAEMSAAYRSPDFALCRVKQWCRSLALRSNFAAELFRVVRVLQKYDEMMAVLLNAHLLTPVATYESGSHATLSQSHGAGPGHTRAQSNSERWPGLSPCPQAR